MTCPPPSATVLLMTPMSPTLPPPYTSPMPRRTWKASARSGGRAEDPKWTIKTSAKARPLHRVPSLDRLLNSGNFANNFRQSFKTTPVLLVPQPPRVQLVQTAVAIILRDDGRGLKPENLMWKYDGTCDGLTIWHQVEAPTNRISLHYTRLQPVGT
jgi:hypothetical protein